MTSRLNQLNIGLVPATGGGITVGRSVLALGYRVPSSPMPRTALQQADSGQPTAPHQPVLRQGVDRVLTAGRSEAAGRQAQGRDGVAVQLDGGNEGADRDGST